MQTVGQGFAYRKETSSAPSFLQRLGLFEKLPVTILLGGVLGLSSPGFNVSWVAWVGLAPLMILACASAGLVDAFIVGLAYGVGYHLVCHRWILELYPLTVFPVPDGVSLFGVGLLWFVESLHQALLFAIFALLIYALPLRAGLLPHYKRPFYPFILSVPVIWVFLQWAVGPSEPFLGVPVNQLAYSQSGNLPIIQVCSIGGSQLLESLIAIFNAAIAALIIEVAPILTSGLPERLDPFSARSGAVFDFLVVALLLVGCLTFGEWRMKRVVDLPPFSIVVDKSNFAPPVPVAVLQGNIAPRPQSLMATNKNERIDRYGNLAVDLGVSLLLLPEAVVPLQDPEGRLLISRLKALCTREKKEAILGTLEILHSDLVNMVRLIEPEKPDDCFYVKNRLLPLVESVPFAAIMKVIPENLFNLLPSSKSNFLESKTPFLLKSVWGNVGASVSFELLYPELIASEVQQGASLLVNVVDLSLFHNTVLSQQLIAAAQIRAVENARYLVMSSNTGISAVINPLGVVTSSSLPGQSGTLLDRVQFLHKTTQYTRMWWLWRPSYRIWWH